MTLYKALRELMRSPMLPEAGTFERCLVDNHYIPRSGTRTDSVTRLGRLYQDHHQRDRLHTLRAVSARIGRNAQALLWDFETSVCTDGSIIRWGDLRNVITSDGSHRRVAHWRTRECERCGAWMPDRDTGVCYTCRVEDEDRSEYEDSGEENEPRDLNRNRILPASANVLAYFPDSAAAVANATELLFGCEIEFEIAHTPFPGARLSRQALVEKITAENPVIVKEDGSLGVGFEINTIPTTLKSQRALIQKLMRTIPPRTVVATNRCGLHVHVSRRGLTQDQMAGAIMLINAQAMQSFIQCVARRSSSRWASVTPKTKQQAERDLRGNDKYVAVNTNHATTLEFRIFKSTVSQATICTAIEFVAAVCGFAGETTNLIDLVDPNRLALYITEHRRAYKNLARWIKRHTIGAQALAEVTRQGELDIAA